MRSTGTKIADVRVLACPRMREDTGLQPGQTLPFAGADIWDAYEFSWLNRWGKPEVALLRWIVPCQSEFTFIPQALQAYFNGYAMQRFTDREAVRAQLATDLETAVGIGVGLALIGREAFENEELCTEFDGALLERLHIDLDAYNKPDASVISARHDQQPHMEVLTSNLLHFRELGTQEPLWASIRIAYTGHPIDHASMLRYLVSYRETRMDALACVEKIYLDVIRTCRPQRLSVYARFTRRYGVDVNPFRCSSPAAAPPVTQRLVRQ